MEEAVSSRCQSAASCGSVPGWPESGLVCWLAPWPAASAVPPSTRPFVPLLALFVLLQLGRLWVISSLGRYWTTRIVTLPDAPLVRAGPFRYFRHPNYLLVIAEITNAQVFVPADRLDERRTLYLEDVSLETAVRELELMAVVRPGDGPTRSSRSPAAE